jgi:RHS repeat-associated protein
MKYTFTILLTLVVSFGGSAFAQHPDSLPLAYVNPVLNYIRTFEAKVPIKTDSALLAAGFSEVGRTTQYLDGLGRPIQTVVHKGSMVSGQAATDMVSTVLYDQAGRVSTQYLPHASAGNNGLFKYDPFSEQAAFYNNYLAGQTGEHQLGPQQLNWAYNKVVYETSPLNRVLEHFAPGSSWVGTAQDTLSSNRKSIKTKETFNTLNDSIKIIRVTDTNDVTGLSTIRIGGHYPAHTLYKTISEDEHGNESIAFTDKQGQLIAKKVYLSGPKDQGNGLGYTGWATTYYIYDDFSRLRTVIQPEGVQHLVAANWQQTALTATLYAEQCFRYEYDALGRMIQKKVPGAAVQYLVYDNRDRLVLSQTGHLRTNQQWLYTLYDALNRPVETGLLHSATSFAAHLSAAGSSSGYPDLSGATYTVLNRTFYDHYNWLTQYSTGLTSAYNNSYDAALMAASNSTWPYAQANVAAQSLKGLVTGSMTRILNTDDFIYSVSIYDDKERIIQTQSTNITGGVETYTVQYSWNGAALVTVDAKSFGGSINQQITTITTLTYDSLWRPVKTQQEIKGTYQKAQHELASMEYDALGNVKTKKIGNATAPLETLHYHYNVRGFQVGVNKEYALNNNNSHFFGYWMGYDKTAIGTLGHFSQALYNGNIAGVNWRSRGDGEIRKFDYSYDAMNRITAADFNQHTGGSYNKSAGLDFSESGYGYDLNGNILAVNRKGWKPGGSTFIDQLQYNYYSLSNQLKNVIDASQDPDSKLGDFKYIQRYHDELGGTKTAGATDYHYDVDGNLKRDLNKYIGTNNVDGIEYNYLNLPQKVYAFAEQWEWQKGTVDYIYTAEGIKLGKVVRNSPNWTPSVTYYFGNITYKNDSLQYISHGEGRTRIAAATAPQKQLVNDYFLRDHLGNVRMVLTEQKDTTVYMATMEAAYRGIENQFFDNLTVANFPTASVPGGYPGGTTGNDSLARVNGSGPKAGPSILLRVMSGDVVDISAKSYYVNKTITPANQNPVLDILTNLSGALMGVTGGTHGSAAQLANPLSSPLVNALNFIRNDVNTATPAKPKAWLNWVLLDEQLQVVAESSGGIHVGNADAIRLLAQSGIELNKNGYLYVYVSNETELWDVFFDDLRVAHKRGPILEETHYYPFGLTMKGISSNAMAFGNPRNKYKFNDGTELASHEFSDGSGLEWYETPFRSYDPQLGRFWQIDELSYLYFDLTPYAFANNNPILLNDPLGLTADTIPTSVLAPVVVTAERTDPDGLDTENGQVLEPRSRFWDFWEGYRVWQPTMVRHAVDYRGYIVPNAVVPIQFIYTAPGDKKGLNLKAVFNLKNFIKNQYVVYKGVKNGKPYFGKALERLSKRYSAKQIEKLDARVITGLDKIPNNAIALGVEQLIIDLNGGIRSGNLANKIPATIKEIYINEARLWLHLNLPNWEQALKFQ